MIHSNRRVLIPRVKMAGRVLELEAGAAAAHETQHASKLAMQQVWGPTPLFAFVRHTKLTL